MKTLHKTIIIAFLFCLTAFPATADVFYHFVLDKDSGSLNYDSLNQKLIGKDIVVPHLYIDTDDDPKTLGTAYQILNGKMSFSLSFDYDTGLIFNGTTQLLSGSNGSVSISGGVNGGLEAELLSGLFKNTNAMFQTESLSNNGITSISSSINFGTSELSPDIDKLFGLDANSVYAPTSLKFVFSVPDDYFNTGSSFEARISSGDITGSHAPVPIPAAAWLFVSGFAGLIGLRKKSKK